MRPFLALITLIVGCASSACGPWISRPCLRSSQAATAFVRQGWREATELRGSWKTRICATESVITHHYGGNEEPNGPACTEEILDEFVTDLLRDSPAANDRLQLARIVGISRASQIAWIMPAKAEALLRVAALRDDDIADYQLTPGERGPPLGKETFRRLALRGLANGHLAMNEKNVREAVIERRRQARDAVDRRLLEGVTSLHFEDTLWGHPKVAVDNGSFALFDQVLAETESALGRPYDEVEHGLLLDHLHLLAFHAKRFGRELPALRLVRSVLAREARVPSVRGKPAARRDLYVAAALAEIECRFEQDDVRSNFDPWYEDMPRSVDQLALEPALYERGFDCRGKTAGDLLLPALLERLAQGSLSPGPELSNDGADLLRLLPERPREVTVRPAVRALLLTHSTEAQGRVRGRNWYENDPLLPLQLAVAASEPGDAVARAFLEGIVHTAGQQPRLWTLSRELLLAARYAKAFGLEGEVRALGDELAAQAPNGDHPSFEALASAGIRASLTATAFDPW